MNGEEQFEQRLQSQPHRPMPVEWREKILSAALKRVPSGIAQHQEPRLGFPHRAPSWLLSLLWPHPKAWAGLAAIWLLVLSLNLATREPASSRVMSQTAARPLQLHEMLRQQEQLLAELLGPVEKPEITPTKPRDPQPRSQRREETLNA